MSENKGLLIDKLIEKYTESHKLSDLHIRADQPIAIREHGQIVTFPDDNVSGEDINKFLKQFGTLSNIKKETYDCL